MQSIIKIEEDGKTYKGYYYMKDDMVYVDGIAPLSKSKHAAIIMGSIDGTAKQLLREIVRTTRTS